MTITTQSSCASITVTDSQLVNTNTSVKLLVTVNCGKQYTLTYANNLTSLVVLPAQLEMEDAISDGVYTVTLQVVKQDSSTYSVTSCHLVDCNLACTIKSFYTKTDIKSLQKVLAYNALTIAKDCYSCDCNSMCLFYNIIKDNCTNELPTTNDCGCQ